MSENSEGERYERERAFHDVAFASDVRAGVADYYPQDSPSSRAYNEALVTLSPGSRVLEYGCGPGSAGFDLAERGLAVTGIDISPVAIEQAAGRAHAQGLDIAFREMNAEDLTFPDASFDAVCGSGILHHLDLARSFSEIARVLRPDGTAVFLEPLGHNPALRLYRRLTPKLRTPDEHPLMKADLESASDQFSSVDVSFHQLIWVASVPARRLGTGNRFAATTERVDTWLFAKMPWLRWHAWTVVIRLAGPR